MPLQLKPLLKQLTIKPKNLDYRRFDLDYLDPDKGDLGWAQRPFIAEIERQYNHGLPVRIIVLKARQLGISTATEGTIFWWEFLHPGCNGLVLSHETKQSAELFEMTKLYWETWPFRQNFRTKYSTKQTLHWSNHSKLQIATAKNLGSGRGSTVQALHASECAFYIDPETLMLGLKQTIPHDHGTIIVLESTANGVGNWFHDQWNMAEEGESEYVPLFFPWFGHSEYRMHTTLTVKSELDVDERQLIKLMTTHLIYPLDMDTAMRCIAWRRWAIIDKADGDIDRFMQEYPSTPDEAFITSGRPIFSRRHLREAFKEKRGTTGFLMDDPIAKNGVRFVNDSSGQFTIFYGPRRYDSRTDRYFVAGDPSRSVEGDPSCIQVINRQTWEQVAVWHGQCDPVSFGYQMMRVGKFYNTAMLCPEVEGGGQATIGVIIARNYPNLWADKRPDRIKNSNQLVYGWSTNWQRKSWCIGDLQHSIIDGSLTIHDRKTYNQLLAYIEHSNGEWGNPTGGHDDSVMALAIAIAASKAEGPFMQENPVDNIILDIYRQQFDLGAA